MSGKRMTNRELVDAAIKLAGDFYSMMGYAHRPGFKLRCTNQLCASWKLMCHAPLAFASKEVSNACGMYRLVTVPGSFLGFCANCKATCTDG